MTPSSTASAVLKQALWFGVLTGLSEAALTGVKSQFLGRFVRVGLDLAWMAPVADVAACLGLGVLLIALARVWNVLSRPSVSAFVFAFYASLSVLFMYYPLELYAKLLLASGVAVQAARLASRWPSLFDRIVNRSVAAMIALVALLAVGTRLGPSIAYQRHVGSLAPAPAGAPNVLLIVWDTVRARNMSLYGYGRRTTPNLERWSSSAAVFDRASSTSSWTLPSHASMMTGRWPQELSADWEEALDDRYPTLAEVLGRRGYLTAGFVANTYYCGRELGLARGFAHYEDYVASPRELLISSTVVRSVANNGKVRRLVGYHDNIPRRSAEEITDQFLAWQSTAGERPFFAFLNFFDAHETYRPPAPFAGRFGPGPSFASAPIIEDVRRSLRRDWPQRPAEDVQREQNMYDGAIAYLDDQLNRLLVELQSRGVLDNTVVIVTSDHGEQFGEHSLFLHANSLYQPLLHVPLVIRFPRLVPEGRKISTRVTLRDLAATIGGLLPLSRDATLPGTSLARHWSGTPDAEGGLGAVAIAEIREADWAKQLFPWYPTAKGNMESVTDDAYHYIRNGDQTEELYAIAADPEERDNLGRQDASLPILEQYRLRLRMLRSGAPH